MVDALDLLQCPTCGTFYVPKGELHCTLAIKPTGPPVRLMDGSFHLDFSEVYVDWDASYARTLERTGLTGAVVDPPLTGTFLDIEV